MNAEGTPLEQHLKRLIRADGPLRFDRYMELCLGHPEHGYYRKRDPFGRSGDFITAPEVSQMFGELIAVWCVDAWDALGQPADLAVVELGPGRGTLMSDVLRALRSVPGFSPDLEVHLVETSPALRALQQQAVAPYERPVAWHDALDTVPAAPCVILANEFFDALPVRQFERRGTEWFERCVGLDEAGELALGLAPGASDASLLSPPALGAEEGAIWEHAPERERVARDVAEHLQRAGGAALIIDYGHLRSGYGDTVQAVRSHECVSLTHAPGLTDLTSHVDFQRLGASLSGAGAAVWPMTTQGAFLKAMGIETRASHLSQKASPEQASDIASGLARLTDCEGMGNLFKVCAATSNAVRPPYPFGDIGT